mgnify:CR=1 FL=1
MIEYGTYSELEEIIDKGCNIARKEEILVVMSMRQSLARRNANNIWGNGFNFESDIDALKTTFNKINRQNRLIDLFYAAEEQKSLYGRAVFTINKTEGGEVKVNLCDPYFFNAVGKVFVDESLAVVYQRFISDTYHFYLRTTYTTEKVTNEWFSKDDAEGKLVVWDKWEEIPKQWRVVKEWKHNLGYVPVMEVTNYPFRTITWSMINYTFLADWVNSSFLEPIFLDTLINFRKEINYCHSRLAITNATQDIIDTIKKSYGGGRINMDDYIIQTETGANVHPTAGNIDFTRYTQAMDSIMDFYYKFSNTSKFSEGGGAQKSSAEASQSRSNTMETIRQKITHIENNYTVFIAKLLGVFDPKFNYFKDNWDFQFKVNGNIQREDTVYLDNIIKQVNLGTMSLVEAIGYLRNIDTHSAELIFNKIKDFNEKNDVMTSMSAMGDDDDFEGSSPQTEGGRKPEKEAGKKDE